MLEEGGMAVGGYRAGGGRRVWRSIDERVCSINFVFHLCVDVEVKMRESVMMWKYVCAYVKNIKAISYFLCRINSHITLLLTRLDGSYNLDLSEITEKIHYHVCQEKKFINLNEKRDKVRCYFLSFSLK